MIAKVPPSVSVTHFLLLFNSLIWLAFGVLVAAGGHPAMPDSDWIRWTFALVSFLVMGLLAVLIFFLKKRNAIAYYLCVGMLILLALGLVFD